MFRCLQIWGVNAHMTEFVCEKEKGKEERTYPFQPNVPYLISWKRQKALGFLTFSGGIEMEHWTKLG